LDDTLVILGLMSSIITLIGIELINHNWFKREIFKTSQALDRKSNDLKLKKMARELGLDKKAVTPAEVTTPASTSMADTLKMLAPFLAKLAPEQIQDMIGQFIPAAEEAPEFGTGGIDGLMDFLSNNPAIVQGFVESLTKGRKNEPSTGTIVSQV